LTRIKLTANPDFYSASRPHPFFRWPASNMVMSPDCQSHVLAKLKVTLIGPRSITAFANTPGRLPGKCILIFHILMNKCGSDNFK